MDARDDRDNRTWVVFELSYAGETAASEGALEGHLRGHFENPDIEIFIPYLSYCYDGRKSLFRVMEGYCFVSSGMDERLYTYAAQESPFLKQALSSGSGGSLVLLTVPERNVQELRDKLDMMVAVDIEDGMEVTVKRGACKGLEGTVVSLNKDSAQVLITMRTLRTIRTIPRFALSPKGEDNG